MTEDEEKIYIDGEVSALKKMVLYCQEKLKAYGVELSTEEKFSSERIEAIAMLRMLCDDHGDNDWTDDLHIADIIQKHLCFHEKFWIGTFKGNHIFVSSDDTESAREFSEDYKTNHT